MALKAVAFDVDGTLYPNSAMYWRSLGLALTNAPLLKALEKAREELRRHPDPSTHIHHVQARIVADQLDLPADRVYALIEGKIYTRWYRIFRSMPVFPHLKGTIEAFRAAGLKLAVLSDFPIRRRLDDLGLPGPWDVAFSSEDTGYLKPHPQSFQLLCDRLGLHPSEVLYVGNSHRYDVLGARSVGMDAAHLARRPAPDSQAALTFSDYRVLKDFVFRRLADPGYNGPLGRVPS